MHYVLVGSGGFSREVASWIMSSNLFSTANVALSFICDYKSSLSLGDISINYLGTCSEYNYSVDHKLLLAIGFPADRKKVASLLHSRGATFSTFIHQSAIVAVNSTIGEGSILCPYSIVSDNARIGSFCLLNLHSTVGHDSTIGDYSTLSSHCDVTGGCTLGEGVMMGSGSRLIPKVSVGRYSKIGAGCTVTRNVGNEQTFYAPLAKRL